MGKWRPSGPENRRPKVDMGVRVSCPPPNCYDEVYPITIYA